MLYLETVLSQATQVQIIKGNFSSLSKTTKLILLDSLLQEVCISSVFDGSLTLSSLGLSVCLSQSQTALFRAKESPLKHQKPHYKPRVCLTHPRQTTIMIWNSISRGFFPKYTFI